jgi:protoheme IX farnesyltransferase
MMEAPIAAPGLGARPGAETAVAVRDYLSALKPRIVLLLTVVTLGTAVVAGGRDTPWREATTAVAAVALASAGASGLNNFLDRRIDALMDRTRHRPLVRGAIDSRALLSLSVALVAAGAAVAALLGILAALFVTAGAMTYALVYTLWLKRRSRLNIVVGGLSGSFAALAGWAAVTSHLSLTALFIGILLFVWTPVHFWTFAIVHRVSYRKAGVPMLPVVSGIRTAVGWTATHAVLVVAASLAIFFTSSLGVIYLAGALLLGAVLLTASVLMWRNPSDRIAWLNYKLSGLYLLGLFVTMAVAATISA